MRPPLVAEFSSRACEVPALCVSILEPAAKEREKP